MKSGKKMRKAGKGASEGDLGHSEMTTWSGSEREMKMRNRDPKGNSRNGCMRDRVGGGERK